LKNPPQISLNILSDHLGFFAFESVKSVASFFAHVHDVGLKLTAFVSDLIDTDAA